MRFINDIIIHCSGNSIQNGKSKVHAQDIVRYHTQIRGWARCGYHYIVECDGSVVKVGDISRPGIHCKGHNAHSIAICYIGGINAHGEAEDTRTPAQKSAILKLVTQLIQLYHCDVHGHRDYSKKQCPSYDAHSEYHNIYLRTVIPGYHG